MMLLELGLGGEIFSLLAKKAPLPDTHARFYYSASQKKRHQNRLSDPEVEFE